MTILARAARLARPRTPRFATPPWHDDHPRFREIDARLEPDHLARVIDQAVQRLDLAPLLATYHGTGSAAHAPDRLLRVVLFEFRRGHHRPAEWYRDARENEPLRWLLRGAEVARSCWYDFRDRVAPLLWGFNQQVLAQALAAGVTTATRGVGDGTLVAANASRHKVVNQATLERRLTQLAATIAADERAAAAPSAVATIVTLPAAAAPPPVAAAEPAATATVPPTVPAAPAAAPPPAWQARTVRGRRQQWRRGQRAQQRLQELHRRNQHQWASKRKAADQIWVSLSDPESVVGRDKEKVFRPLYNVQVMDDLDSPLLLGYAVFAQQNDSGVLPTLLQRTHQLVGHNLEVVLLDGAYAGDADLAAADQEGVTVYAPVPGDGVQQPKQIPKREFTWQAAEQTYVCPQGHRLVFEESWREKRADGSLQVWRYRCPPVHCQGCPLQARCTQKPASGRAVTRREHEDLIEALRARMSTAAAKALYRLRSQNVELVNADWKEHRKLRRFSGRGLVRVECAVGLVVLVHNLLTVLAAQKAPATQAASVP